MKSYDRHIVKRIKKGDVKSFEALFHQYYPGMLLYSQSLIRKKEPAEEIVQDVFYNVWKNRENFHLNSTWKSYLFRAVYNNSLIYLRKMKREIHLEEIIVPTNENLFEGPAEELVLKELNKRISKILESMPSRTRQIFTLSRFEGMTYHEIAKNLSISVKTVEANMGKALKVFRSSLEEYRSISK